MKAIHRTHSVLWRRLDSPGHDACRLVQDPAGWRLEGTAVFRHADGGAASLTYEVLCDRAWGTRSGTVRGWLGARRIEHRIERKSDGRWALDGQVVQGLEECVDLDLGFTPATNLCALRRMALDVGQAGETAAAWIDLPDARLQALRQHYERRAADAYWYRAPRFDYAATLRVDAEGFVLTYPGLWEAEGAGE